MDARSQQSTLAFPRGLATGPAFCNRDAEKAELARRINSGAHSWLAAPRRYGKTSLLHQVLLERHRARTKPKVRGAVLDLLPTYDQTSLVRTLLQGVGELVGALVPRRKQLLEAGMEFLGNLRPKLTVTLIGAQLELAPRTEMADTIVDALTGLDRLCAEAEARACLVLDEFQQLAEWRDGRPMEAAIRHAVERAKHVTYIFSGSHRHLLEQLFTDRSRPLYLLCEPMDLSRIGADAYRIHLQQRAVTAWRRPLEGTIINQILGCTERHPYYVNLLCARLWREQKAPSTAEVISAWQDIARTLRNWLASELDSLSPTKRAVLVALAVAPAAELTGKAFIGRTRLAKSSIAQAVEALERAAHIDRNDQGRYTVIDPALAEYLRGSTVEIPTSRGL